MRSQGANSPDFLASKYEGQMGSSRFYNVKFNVWGRSKNSPGKSSMPLSAYFPVYQTTSLLVSIQNSSGLYPGKL